MTCLTVGFFFLVKKKSDVTHRDFALLSFVYLRGEICEHFYGFDDEREFRKCHHSDMQDAVNIILEFSNIELHRINSRARNDCS